MMKRLATILLIVVAAAISGGWRQGTTNSGGGGAIARSQLNAGNVTPYTYEYTFINSVKSARSWQTNNSPVFYVGPPDLDTNGWPLPSSSIFSSNGGFTSVVYMPSQAESPGNNVMSWIGSGTVKLSGIQGTLAPTFATCTGVGSTNTCNNAGCSTFTGYISGTTLTVTAAPTGTGCALQQYQPISGPGVTIT